MNTVTKPYKLTEKVVPLKPKRTRRERLRPETSTVVESQTPEPLPRRETFPLWLRSLFVFHNLVSLVTFSSLAASLTIYGITVYTPGIWSKEYTKLRTLQRDERQLTATNESLKNQLAKQAEKPETGLVDPSSNNAPLFIPAQPVPQVKTRPTPSKTSEIIVKSTPLGY